MKSYDEEDSDDEMICVLGGSLRDSERRPKSMKKHNMMVAANDMMDSMMYNEGGFLRCSYTVGIYGMFNLGNFLKFYISSVGL